MSGEQVQSSWTEWRLSGGEQANPRKLSDLLPGGPWNSTGALVLLSIR